MAGPKSMAVFVLCPWSTFLVTPHHPPPPGGLSKYCDFLDFLPGSTQLLASSLTFPPPLNTVLSIFFKLVNSSFVVIYFL